MDFTQTKHADDKKIEAESFLGQSSGVERVCAEIRFVDAQVLLSIASKLRVANSVHSIQGLI
jgi:hypothetical protein